MNNDSKIILLGEYEIPDAKRIIAALDQAQIPFDLEERDLPTHLLSEGGAYGQISRLKVWLRSSDLGKAQALQNQCLKIEK